jgi:hydrogenase expression/formation protein HypE
MTSDFTLSCPIPISDYPEVLLAHGGGGRLMRQLIGRMFFAAFGGSEAPAGDSAVLDPGRDLSGAGRRLAFTTDSFVVRPLEFPGGDIGKLAVCGTVNDLAMAGARPAVLSAGFILEEGLPIPTLWRVVCSMRDTAVAAGVRIVTGDTKVVDRGKGDGIFINTSGLGVLEHSLEIGPASVRPGDTVIVSGDLGRHGIAIMAVREGLEFESQIESDCAPLWEPVRALLEAGVTVHCLRDLTRGGLASALNEIAADSGTRIHIREAVVPVREDVRGACEILGFDPLYVANEGRFVAFVPSVEAERAVGVLRAHPLGSGAAIIGEVVSDGDGGVVTLQSAIGANRILDLLSGEQLPRIC